MEEDIEKEIKTIVEYCRKRDCSEEECKYFKNDDICRLHNPSAWEV